MITVKIATIPERKLVLQETVKSLIDQVDKIIIFLNGYDKEIFKNPKIEQYITPLELSDRSKFLIETEGYNLTCDDKYIYPKDYVQTLINGIDKYKCIVGFHGRKISIPVKTYYGDRNQIIYNGLNQVDEDKKVNVIGTGMMGYNKDHISIPFDIFKEPDMTDIYLALYAKSKIDLMVLKHDFGYIKLDPKFKSKNTIFNRYRKNDNKQTNLINQLWPQ